MTPWGEMARGFPCVPGVLNAAAVGAGILCHGFALLAALENDEKKKRVFPFVVLSLASLFSSPS
jgi:hypothetical protein